MHGSLVIINLWLTAWLLKIACWKLCFVTAQRITDGVGISSIWVPLSNSTSFRGLPSSWEIPLANVKLICSGGRPVELGRGGFGIVLRYMYMIYHHHHHLIYIFTYFANTSLHIYFGNRAIHAKCWRAFHHHLYWSASRTHLICKTVFKRLKEVVLCDAE